MSTPAASQPEERPSSARRWGSAARTAALVGVFTWQASPAWAAASNGGLAFGALGLAGVGAIAAAAGSIAWSRRRRRNNSPAGRAAADPNQRYGPGGVPVASEQRHTAPAESAVPLPELHKRAGEALIATDNAVQSAQEELAFAQLQFGDEAVAPYQEALEQAKQHLQQSFALQQKLEDSIPDTEAEQRAWIGEILARCQQARQPLAQQRDSFSQLRAMETNVPRALDEAVAAATALQPQLEAAGATLDRLAQRYSRSAWQTLPDNLDQARDRLEFVDTAAQEARGHVDGGNRSEAVLEVRAAEQAVAQASELIGSIDRGARDLEQAERSLRDAIAIAHRDVAEAEATAQVAMRTELTGTAAGVRSVLAGIEAELAAGTFDPLALSHRLSVVSTELEKALSGLREEHERDRAARATLDRTMVSAQAAVTQAHDYLSGRRGGVGSGSRTHLAEAERHLSDAQRLRNTEPSTALNHANEAIRLAGSARQEAQEDVSGFQGGGFGGSWGGSGWGGSGWGGSGRPRGNRRDLRGAGGAGGAGRNAAGLGGAVLGGILLGSMLDGLGDDDAAHHITDHFSGGFGENLGNALDPGELLGGLGDLGGFDF